MKIKLSELDKVKLTLLSIIDDNAVALNSSIYDVETAVAHARTVELAMVKRAMSKADPNLIDDASMRDDARVRLNELRSVIDDIEAYLDDVRFNIVKLNNNLDDAEAIWEGEQE